MVYLFLADGFEEVEALLPLDILRRGGVEVTVAGVPGKFVRGTHGVGVAADCEIAALSEIPEMVILPGGMPGAAHLDASPEVEKWLRLTLEKGGRAAAICAAPMVLGHKGLLRGKRAVCFPGFEAELTGALPAEERVVTDGAVTTAVGMGAAAEFGRELLSLLRGPEAAERVWTRALFG